MTVKKGKKSPANKKSATPQPQTKAKIINNGKQTPASLPRAKQKRTFNEVDADSTDVSLNKMLQEVRNEGKKKEMKNTPKGKMNNSKNLKTKQSPKMDEENTPIGKKEDKNNSITKETTPNEKKEVKEDSETKKTGIKNQFLFLRNFPNDTTEADLKKLDPRIKTVNLRARLKRKKVFRFAFLEFETANIAENALTKLKNHKFKDETLFVEHCNERQQEDKNSKVGKNSDLDNKKLMVTGFGNDITIPDLKTLFPSSTKIDLPKRKKFLLGMAFIHFDNEKQAKTVLAQSKNKSFSGNVLNVMYARKREQPVKKKEKKLDAPPAKKAKNTVAKESQKKKTPKKKLDVDDNEEAEFSMEEVEDDDDDDDNEDSFIDTQALEDDSDEDDDDDDDDDDDEEIYGKVEDLDDDDDDDDEDDDE